MPKKGSDMNMNDILAFKELAPAEIEEIEAVATKKEYQSNEFICREGDPGNSLYIIESGQVRISKITPIGTEKVLSRLGPRSFFGEMSIIDGQPRSACAIADLPTTVYSISKDDIDVMLEKNSLAAYKIIRAFARVLSYRLRKMNEELVSLFSEPDKTIREIIESEEKLLKYLLISGWYYEGPE